MSFSTGKNKKVRRNEVEIDEIIDAVDEVEVDVEYDVAEDFGEVEESKVKRGGGYTMKRGFTQQSVLGNSDTFKKVFDKINASENNELIVIDKRVGVSTRSDANVLVLATAFGNNVFWHMIVLETRQLPVVVEEEKNNRWKSDVDIFTYGSTYDGVTSKYVSQVTRVLEENYPGATLRFTDAIIIPSEVEINEQTVAQICFLSEDANYALANEERPFRAKDVGDKCSVQGTLRFNNDNVKLDMLGRPYRADYTVDLTLRDRSSQTELLLEDRTNTKLVEVDGYVDAVYVGTDEDIRSRRNEGRIVPQFLPEIVVTSINTYVSDTDAGQFDRGVLGLAALPFLNTNKVWLRQFDQNFSSDENRVSGFAYGMAWANGIPDDVEEIDDASTDDRTNWLESIFYQDEASVAVLVKDGGVDFTLGRLLMNIGEGGSEEAIRRLFKSANDITANEFSDICRRDGLSFSAEQIVTSTVRVPTGYFKTAGSAEDTPIEMVDTLYLLNAIKSTSPDMIEDWYDATSDSCNMDYDEALSRLVNIFNHVTGKNFVLKGFATKVYLDGEFISTLYKAVSKGALSVHMEADITTAGRPRRIGSRVSARRGGLKSNLALRDRERNSRGTRRRLSLSQHSYY